MEGIGTLYGGGQKFSLGLGAKVKVTHACSSNDNTAPAFARIVVENNNAMVRVVDDKLDKALGEWLV